MAAPARGRTSTPACTRGHAEGPSLARLQLSPASQNFARTLPRAHPQSSQNSHISPARPAPNPQGSLRSHQRTGTQLAALAFPGPRPAPLGSAPSGCAGGRRGRRRGRRAGGGAEGGGAAAPGADSARAREMPVSAARAAAAAAAGEAAAGPRRGAAQGAGA